MAEKTSFFHFEGALLTKNFVEVLKNMAKPNHIYIVIKQLISLTVSF